MKVICMQTLGQVCVSLILLANKMPRQEWIYGFIFRDVNKIIYKFGFAFQYETEFDIGI